MKCLLKVLVMVGVGMGGAAPAFGASHGGHHGGGHASAAHRGSSGRSYGSRATAPNRGRSAGYYHGGTAPNYRHGGSAAQRYGHPGYQGSYYATHGRRFQGGYYYPGRNHPHWAYTVFDDRYGCTLYYDQDLGCYYYWCEPDDNYYPVSYCPYNRYAWVAAVDEQHSDGDGHLKTDLEDLSAKLQ